MIISTRPTSRPLIEDFTSIALEAPRGTSVPEALVISFDGAAPVKVTLSATIQVHGGRRWWLTCPRCGCRRRKLLAGGQVLGCRGCFGTTYRSQRVSPSRRPRR